MEILIAALLPVSAAMFLASRFAASNRRALTLLALIPLLWFAPCWLSGRSPVGFDFISQHEPWKSLRDHDYLDKNPLLNDVALQVVPFREELRSALLRFELPELSRFLGGQTPLLANLQTAPFYPVNLISVPLSSFAWPLFSMITKMLIALFGTFLFLRRLERSVAASSAGAIAYACGAFTIAWLAFPMTNVTVLLPLLLYAIDGVAGRAIAATSSTCDAQPPPVPGFQVTPSPLQIGICSHPRRRIAFASLVLASMLLGGHPESVLHAALLAIPYAIIRARRAPVRICFASLTFGFVALLLAGIVLIPFVLYLPHSQRMADINRSETFLSSQPMGFDSLVPMLVPNYFGNPRAHNYRHDANFNELCTGFVGLTTLVLATVALLADGRSRRSLFLLVPLSFLAYPLPMTSSIVRNIPLLDITAHGRLRFVIALILAMLASRAIDLLATDARARALARVVALSVVCGVVILLAVSYPEFARVGIRRLIAASELAALAGCSLLALFPSRTKWLPLLLLLDLFSVVGLYNPSLSRRWFYPSNESLESARIASTSRYGARVTGLGLALQPNSASMLELSEVRPHDPLAFAPYVSFLEKAGLQRSSYFAQFPQTPRSSTLDFLGVTSIFREDQANAEIRSTSLDRFFVARELMQAADPAKAFLAQDDPRLVFSNEAPEKFPTATISGFSMNSSERSFRVEASGEAFIASSEVSLPGWKLKIDGGPAPITDVNGPFIGFQVPSGRHEVSLHYTTPGRTIGAAMSLVGLILLMLLIRRGPGKTVEAAEPARLV